MDKIKLNLNRSPKTAILMLSDKLHHYQAIVVALIALLVIGYTIIGIGQLLDPQLDQGVYQQQLQNVKPIEFNQDAVEAIRNLEDPAGPVKSQLPSNRNNPF